MGEFKFPEIDPAAMPEFTDGASCKAWLASVPLANIAAAQRRILVQIEELNRCALRPRQRLEALEAVREAVHFVQIEQAKRFTHRALPMLAAETAVFEETIDLWEQMRLGYLRCLEADDPALRAQGALLCQRALAYSGLRIYHHYRAYREVPARDWRGLHRAYARAEALGVTDARVKDYLNRDVHESSPRVAYVRALLTGMCSPNELGPRQLTFVAYLLERWADKVEVRGAPVDEGDMPPLSVDLAGERGAERGPAEGAEPRYLDARRLAKSLRNRIALLRKGESPARLALGEDCVQPSCEQLLLLLYRHWCQARQARAVQRRRVSDATQAATGIDAIHYYLSGQVFRGAAASAEFSAKKGEEIATFGRVRADEGEDYGAARSFLLEHWQLGDESVQGLKMLRRAGNPGRRMTHGQLVGVRPADGKTFQLGQVRWLMATEAGDLHCGVKLLPGVPLAAAVRGAGVRSAEENFVQAIALAAVPALNAPRTLVTPAGWFKPRRVLEATLGKPARLRLLELLERGTDFERATYEVLPD